MATFLLACVRNNCLKMIRAKQVRQRASRFLQTDDCIDMTPIDAQTDRLIALLDYCEQELTPRKLRVFQLRHQQQKTYAEIASTLGISEAAVYKHLTMAGTSTMKISYRNQTTR